MALVFFIILEFLCIAKFREATAFPGTRTISAPDLQIASPGYFRELKEVVGYETTAKLVISVGLPLFAEMPFPPENKKMYEMSYTTTKVFLNDFHTYLNGLKSTTKQKRQVLIGLAGAAIGYTIHSIYSSLAQKFSGTESEAAANIHQLWESLRLHNKEFLFFQDRIHGYSANLSSTFHKLALKLNDLELSHFALLHLTQINIVTSKIHRGLNSCLRNYIPFDLVNATYLEERLTILSQNLTIHGYKFAINPKNLLKLQKLKLTDCFVTTNSVHILINIPVTKTDWKVNQLLPYPFAYKGQTCVLSPNRPELVAISRDTVKLISSYMMSYCDFRTDFLCLVPDLFPTDHASACASYLYNSRAFLGGSKHTSCKFECKSTQEPSIVQVEKNKIIATNIQSLSVICPHKKYQTKTPTTGALEIPIQCKCTYHLDTILVVGNDICVSDLFNSFGSEEIVQIIPDFLVSSANALTPQVLRENWPDHIPVLNFTLPAEIPPLQNNLGPFEYREWLLFLVTIVVLAVTIFSIIAGCK